MTRPAILAALVAAAAFTATPVTGQLVGTWEVTGSQRPADEHAGARAGW